MRLLSHPLTASTPAYMDNPNPSIEPRRTVAADGNRAYSITFGNHTGTHLDAPAHFFEDGRRLGGLDIGQLLFERPLLVEVGRGDGELIGAAELEPWAGRIGDADLVLVRTGYGAAWRTSDPHRYRHQGPGFAGQAAGWLRQTFPGLRAVGMDFISATSPAHPDEGRSFHLGALDESSGPALLLIEDVLLDPKLASEDLGRVLVAPLWLSELDGAPVTMVAGL